MRYNQSIQVKAPATVANMVCGFDVLGFAVREPYDLMTLRLREEPGILIRHKDSFGLPEAATENVAGVALMALMETINTPVGFELSIEKQIKPGSGLGSSAASAAGAVVAANLLLGDIFSKEDLVRFAMHGEKLASGVKHADNIAPCIYGGTTLIRSAFPLDIITLPSPELYVSIVHPQIEVKTADARSILRQQILLKDAIRQWGNIAGLVAGILQNDHGLIERSMEDVLIEPARSILIPGFDKIKQASKAAGSLGGGISGSGPSVFMLSDTAEKAGAVAQAMQDIYQAIGLEHYTYVTTINASGVEVLA
ncbi:MAG: homoserine kinase [Chitinophagaceae bacterium]|nr:homoserine kinase [Chitinophagaceae bacterium]